MMVVLATGRVRTEEKVDQKRVHPQPSATTGKLPVRQKLD